MFNVFNGKRERAVEETNNWWATIAAIIFIITRPTRTERPTLDVLQQKRKDARPSRWTVTPG